MSDVTSYTRLRATVDPKFTADLESGYADFKLGVLLRLAREDAGLTQGQLAERLKTHKSAISRIEKGVGNLRLSTLARYAQALGCRLSLELRSNRRARGRAARQRQAAGLSVEFRL